MTNDPSEHIGQDVRDQLRREQLDRIARRAYTRAYAPTNLEDYADGHPYPYEPSDYEDIA